MVAAACCHIQVTHMYIADTHAPSKYQSARQHYLQNQFAVTMTARMAQLVAEPAVYI